MPVYVSDLLTATAAPVSAAPSSTRTWQWLRGSTSISGATTTAYTATTDDLGSTISASQSEANFLGSATATSAATETVEAYNPVALFRASEPGVWYDPNDLSTLFQDAAGTIPVTGPVGPTGLPVPVGLMLDKSKGPQGPQLVTNGNFDNGLTGWTVSGPATLSVIGGELSVVSTGGAGGARAVISTVAGRQYHIFGTSRQITSRGQINVGSTEGGADLLSFSPLSGAITVGGFFIATGPLSYLSLNLRDSTAGVEVRYDNISVRETQGNHATQATEANKPIYGVVPAGGRRNLLTWTEDFSNADWQKNGISLSAGSSSASTVITATAVNGGLLRFVSVSPNAVICTNSIEIRRITGTGPIELKLPGNGGNPITVTSNWTRFSSSGAAGGPFDYYLLQIATIGDALEIRYPQAELGSTATPYQKVTNQYGVTEAGVTSCGYLFFDGVNDSMVTSTITPGTDKAQVFAGVRKLQDVNVGFLAELGGSTGTVAGSFVVAAPGGPFPSYYAIAINRGAYFERKAANPGLAAPINNVISALLDFAQTGTGKIGFRVNGAVETLTTVSGTDAGTGNFAALPLYIGARAGTSLFLSGNLFPLIVRFGPNLTAARILATELWVGERTQGVDIPKSISTLIYTRSGDTILDRANSIIERRTV